MMAFCVASGAAEAVVKMFEAGGGTEVLANVSGIDGLPGGSDDAHKGGVCPPSGPDAMRALDRVLGSRTNAMNLAARHGLLAIVQWLHENGTEGCTTEAMDGAAIAGHLRVVQWLRMHRSEGCTEAALASTHYGIVQFLLAHRPADCRRPKSQ